MTLQIIELLAVLACTLFTGAAVYITAVEHPARLSCGTQIAATEWAPRVDWGLRPANAIKLSSECLSILAYRSAARGW